MKSVIFATVVVLVASVLASAASHQKPQKKRKNGLTAETDFRAMSPDEVTGLLGDAEHIKVDHSKTYCNGKRPSWDHVHSFELACAASAEDGQDIQNQQVLLRDMQALFRGCALYATSESETWGGDRSGYSCGLLGSLFFAIGNEPAARAVWDAPGCHSHDMNGHPVNGCMPFIVGHIGIYGANLGVQVSWVKPLDDGPEHAYDSERSKLIAMAQKACSQDQDGASCLFLQAETPAAVNWDAVEKAKSERYHDLRDRVASDIAERREEARESNARFNATMDTLRSMPGGSDPNAIVNAGNQQGAQMMAIGAANDAARQQASAERQAAPLMQAQTAQPQLDSQPASIARAAQPPSLPITDNSSVNPPATTAHYAAALPSNCIGQFWDPKYYNWLSFQNNCGQAVYVSWIAANSSDKFGFSSATLLPGGSSNSGWSQDEVQRKGGFLFEVCPAGYLPVDALTDQPVYRATQEFRCKQQ